MTCPLCDTLSDQWWRDLYLKTASYSDTEPDNYNAVPELRQVTCNACAGVAYWFGDRMVHPPLRMGPPPHDDAPGSVKELYREAQAVAGASPRAAAVLLRVALERLMSEAGSSGKTLNDAIGDYVAAGGVPAELQQAMDTVRITGNDAAHPEELRLDDTAGGVAALFEIVNELVDRLVGFKARMARIYENLDPAKLDQVKRRDGSAEPD